MHRKAGRSRQNGSVAVEFPFVVIGVLIILFGLVTVYKVQNAQTQLNEVAFSLTNAVATTLQEADIADESAIAQNLVVVAKRLLPESINVEQIGLVLQVVSDGSAPKSFNGGNEECEVETPVSQLTGMAPKTELDSRPGKDTDATLIQLVLCIYEPVTSQHVLLPWHWLPLPDVISSRSLLIGRSYE
ncbi:tight adherence pilus pseudopilin TadF [Vibrio sp. SCSIO 43137]|uniref:tight adherence pilus pseudopilin TadF n=1 Tax=Vibrio sp. SCSIO 43137 TaxID=3021011 RepID=UPI002306FFE1|nr:tight adherence pilus pseudopilin TadF [Vibrio sp. SCSIO 43137]WCE28699.1 tight adherence pilus pseudopilin TadF [Vibrio sp. SCSIO 43137]